MQDEVKALVNELFEKLNIKTDSIDIENIDDSNIFKVKIKTEESNLLIWIHGRTLDSLQNILKLMCSNKIWERIKLHIEVNDYIKTKDDRLLDFIKKEILYLEKTGKDIKLPFYSAYERKKIHSFIHSLKNDNISSKSIWEGKERRLYLCKKVTINKLTIDIDWDDI